MTFARFFFRQEWQIWLAKMLAARCPPTGPLWAAKWRSDCVLIFSVLIGVLRVD
jgi:hypothetical protein